jgi:inosine-uridine nucleoside N-ribohydrolase
MVASPTNGRLPVVIISDLVEYGDDGIAILMLLQSGRVDIRGIITTSGNLCASRSATETKRLMQSVGAASVPVVQGFPFSWHDERRRFYENVERSAWQRPAYVGAFADPRSCNFAGDGEGTRKGASNTEAADFLIDQVRAAREDLTIILIGPATVLAEAMRKEPHLGDHIRHVYAMGGTIAVAGNVTQYAEFNVWFDPEAMAAILASKVSLTLVPLDATTGITYDCVPHRNIPPRDIAATHLKSYLERAGAKGSPVGMWDEVLAATVIDPAIAVTSREIYLSVSITKDERYGKLISYPAAADGNARPVEVVTNVRSDGVCQLVTRLLLTGG